MSDAAFLPARQRIRHVTRRRLTLWLGAAAAVTIALVLGCPLLGADVTGQLAVLDLAALGDGLGGDPNTSWRLFAQLRLPRALAGAACGAALAAAGCSFQAVLRNPLAEPYTLGISSGASLAALLAIRAELPATVLGGSAPGLAALAGAALTAALVSRLGRVGSALPPATLILAGITVAMICSAASMLVIYTADFAQVGRIVHWMMGSLEGASYIDLARGAVPIAIGTAALWAVARDLNPLSAGAEAAASVGVAAGRTILIAFVTSSLIVGASISLAGPVGFVGLLVPHAARAVVGPDHRILLPTSVFAGASLVVVADTAGRVALPPDQLPVGLITALLGGPFFLYLLLREKRHSRFWRP